MENQALVEIIKLGSITGLLAFIALTLWKRFDARVKEMSSELKELKDKYDSEIISDRLELRLLVKENTQTLHEVKDSVKDFKNTISDIAKNSTLVISRCNQVMQCLTEEIKEIKPNLKKAFQKTNN